MDKQLKKKAAKSSALVAFRFVFTMGIVNLFGDMTYEGGGSINSQFLGALGASAAAIGIIADLGEFRGYSLRSVFGYIADKTEKYWLVTFIGYFINTLAVPPMALAGSWQVAGAPILAERVGRAIRKPTVEAMLSYTTGKHGRGWVYAVNTALNEIRATIGPLVVAVVLFLNGNYRTTYALLLISTVLTRASLTLIDLASGKPLANWMPPGLTANFPLNLDESGHAVIVVFRSPAKLAMFDMTTGAMIASADTCGDFDDVFFDEKRRRIYVSCGSGFIDVFQREPAALMRLMRLATGREHPCSSPNWTGCSSQCARA